MLILYPSKRWMSCIWVSCIILVLLALPAQGQEKASAFADGQIEALDEEEIGSFEEEIQSLDEVESLAEDESLKAEEQSQSPTHYSAPQPINRISLSLDADLPAPQVKRAPSTTRNSCATCRTVKSYQWSAPNDVYQNLMFEEPLLERHGISTHPRLQPVISGFKFLKSGFLYPLDVAKGYHKRCDNPLGWGLPGNYCR